MRNEANCRRSFKFEVSNVKQEKQMVGTSNFTLHTAHSDEGRFCETKPISAGAKRKASALQERIYGESCIRQAPEKQSQFRRSGPSCQTNPISAGGG